MSMLLPPVGHVAREAIGPLSDLVGLLAPENRKYLLPLQGAILAARRCFMQNPDRVRSVFYIVMEGDDSIRMYRFGPKGGRTVVWTFREGSG